MRPGDVDVALARHQFPLGVVAGSLELVLRAGTRLKRVAAVLAMHWRWCGLDMRSASYYSVRLWLLRLGLYQLSRAKIQADDWIWIADHTMQLGERKCLILVGIRQSAWDAEDRILAQEDVELIDLVPVTESNWGGGFSAVAGSHRQDRGSAGHRQRRRSGPAWRDRPLSPGPSDHGLVVRHQTQDSLPPQTCPGRGCLVANVRGKGPSLQAAGVVHPAGSPGASAAAEQGAVHERRRAGRLGQRVVTAVGSSPGDAEGGLEGPACGGEVGVVAEVRPASAAVGGNAGSDRNRRTLCTSRGHPSQGRGRACRRTAQAGDPRGMSAS